MAVRTRRRRRERDTPPQPPQPTPPAPPPIEGEHQGTAIAPEPPLDVADMAPPSPPSWDMRARTRLEAMAARAATRRRILIVVAIVLAAVLLVVLPVAHRARNVRRWQACVERVTGSTVPSGRPVSAAVIDRCGTKPGTRRQPYERRN
jgi:hypothetical protein